MWRFSLSLCVSLIVWFCTFSSQSFMYSLFIISVLSVTNDGTVDFILVWDLVLMCSLTCEKVEQDRFQLLLSFFPSIFISLCLQTALFISKNTHFHVYLGIKIVEWQISVWVFLKRLSFPVFLCFHWSSQITYSWAILQSVCWSETFLIHSEDNSHVASSHCRSVFLLKILWIWVMD